MEIVQDYFNIKTNLPIVNQFTSAQTNPARIAADKMLDDQLTVFRTNKALFDIMLVNPEGMVVYANNMEHHTRYMGDTLPGPGDTAFEEGTKGIYLSDVFMLGGRFEMLLTAPAHDLDGNYIGVIAFEVDMRPLYESIQDTTGLGETGETLVGTRVGDTAVFLNPLRHDKDAALKRRAPIGGPDAIPIQQAVQGKDGAGVSIDYRGEEIIAAWRHVPSVDWGLVAKIDTSEAYAAVNSLRRYAGLITWSSFAIALILMLLFSATITRPIGKLSDMARRVSRVIGNCVPTPARGMR